MGVNPLQQQACSLMELGTFFAECDTCGVYYTGRLVVGVFNVATFIKVYWSSSITNTPFFSFFPQYLERNWNLIFLIIQVPAGINIPLPDH